jgi:hypothetical protein
VGHISVMLWALEVGEGWFLSQFLMGNVLDFVFKTPFARVGAQKPVSDSMCLIHWLPHPDFLRKSCDKGLEAVTKQPLGTTMMAMTYQDQVLNKGAGKTDPP